MKTMTAAVTLQIKGTDIPIGARIIRIVDSFDAMTTDRP